MSQAVVKAALDFPEVGFIPSQNQVNDAGGYTGWTDEAFHKYVKGVNDSVIIEADHMSDIEYSDICRYNDIIHIDPWKRVDNFIGGVKETIRLLTKIHSWDSNIFFEIGTEESVYPFTQENYMQLLHKVSLLPSHLRYQIKYIVVQSGTGLDLPNRKNVGSFNANRLLAQTRFIHRHGYSCKEHNGDYLSSDAILLRFQLGVDAINIAPELGQIESDVLIRSMNQDQLNEFERICDLHSVRWKKWVSGALTQRQKLLTAGHYVLDTLSFEKLLPDIKDIDRTYYEINYLLKKRLSRILVCLSQS